MKNKTIKNINRNEQKTKNEHDRKNSQCEDGGDGKRLHLIFISYFFLFSLFIYSDFVLKPKKKKIEKNIPSRICALCTL